MKYFPSLCRCVCRGRSTQSQDIEIAQKINLPWKRTNRALRNLPIRSDVSCKQPWRVCVARLGLCLAPPVWLSHPPYKPRTPIPRLASLRSRSGMAQGRGQDPVVSPEESSPDATSTAAAETGTNSLTGEAARERLRKTGHYESLGGVIAQCHAAPFGHSSRCQDRSSSGSASRTHLPIMMG